MLLSFVYRECGQYKWYQSRARPLGRQLCMLAMETAHTNSMAGGHTTAGTLLFLKLAKW